MRIEPSNEMEEQIWKELGFRVGTSSIEHLEYLEKSSDFPEAGWHVKRVSPLTRQERQLWDALLKFAVVKGK